MYIKQIIIQDFKSYRNQTVVDPFDERHNVVVGRNGTGKSNFFCAIQFVLSDEFAHLKPELRQALLHVSTGQRVMSAYVEIVFDNSDLRVPIDKKEFYLRRVIGLKNDQYFLNKKLVPRREVMDLLKAAGFSSSNPYYIVKQGKINEISTAPDSHRLNILQEVAGTKVYDERRNESIFILREAEEKIIEIDKCLLMIDERFSKLEEEKEELKQCQNQDKIRRALEYTIYELEMVETKKKLNDLKTQRKHQGEIQDELQSNLKTAQDDMKTIERKFKDTKKKLSGLKEEQENLSNDQHNLIKKKTQLELKIKDLVEEVEGDNKSKKKAENELGSLAQSIREKETELLEVKPQYEALKKLEEERTRELALKEQKRKVLYAKQGRGTQFTSKEDRDKWIQQELKSLNNQLKDKEQHRNRLEVELTQEAAKMVELTKKIEEHSQELERQKNSMNEHNRLCFELNKEKDQLQITKNENWRKENNLQKNLTSLKEDLAKADHQLRFIAGKDIQNGRQSVRKVLDTFMRRGGAEADVARSYFGSVIENFECNQSIYTAVEVTAGNRLFHHIVESDQVGTKILKEMNRQKLPGVVYFMALNRLEVRKINYPSEGEAIPLVSKLQYNLKYDKAMRFLFGHTLICRSLDVATKLARRTRLDCVTLDGDQVSPKGPLTGGYYHSSRSRLRMQKNRNEILLQLQQCEDDLKNLRAELTKTDSSINTIVSEIQKIKTKYGRAKGIFDLVNGEQRLIRGELSNIERFKISKERALAQCKSHLEAMLTTQEALESELHQELLSQLSVADQAEVDSLNKDILRLQEENKDASSTLMTIETAKNQLENLLNNLSRKRDEVLNILQVISLEDREYQLETCKSKLEIIYKNIDEVNEKLTNFETKVKEMTEKLTAEQNDLDEVKKQEKELQETIYDHAKLLEKYATKQNLLELQITDYEKKINQLGTLPVQDLCKHYKTMSLKSLFKELEKTNKNLKKYKHVNKKALDHFNSFSEQKEILQKRKETVLQGVEEIRELIELSEQRKMETIQFTFRQVSQNFTEVFKKLVPTGRAKLIMKSKNNDEDTEIGIIGATKFENCTGIGVEVSFIDSESEMMKLNQLSGGQKSLVALSLIFAIQKSDPAPFYLFDEIDQALDAHHRAAVAEMIQELSKEAQFITTTFRPELLEHAHKFYGVKFRNKVSHIESISKEVAKDFVKDKQTHD